MEAGDWIFKDIIVNFSSLGVTFVIPKFEKLTNRVPREKLPSFDGMRYIC